MIYKSEFLNVLGSRGYINQCTDLHALDESAYSGKLIGYIGFDCTASSLHVGSLIQIMMLRRMQQCGHMPVVLLGGATTKIGDPSGKTKERQILEHKQIEENKESILKSFKNFINFDVEVIVLDNNEWLSDLNYIDFLDAYGRYFSVNRMLSFDSVKLRLEREAHLSFLEFNYMILQSYDFLKLNELHGCALQMGGSDQWGNIVSGVELIRKKTGKEVYGLTSELLVTSSGVKMGKTEKGAVWLNEDMLSSYDYWQFWRNTSDQDVIKFLKLFTDIELVEINRLSQLKDKDLNEAKILLANECTKMCRGEEAASLAYKTASAIFSGNSSDFESATLHEVYMNASEVFTMPVHKAFLIVELASSSSDAKRLIRGGGARINNNVVQYENRLMCQEDFHNGVSMLSAGKKKYAILKLVTDEK
ncbi:Tyrosine--tRNA ligase [Candidatus Cyrtobacter comes]|uniref:Tyrosine--tRNA ligase n=1 Tax=Candidatus Cyrtobacter comes TaxID=675776 RepID=A0ABU5L6Q8_9RICK|nr:tyrosine--tRNA ligase [Candidatus Cyrtobacter comes]MDZ5761809.1 Tyrosine--tRNA ligase [Candidatus Cyrtobacter comes]